MFVKLWIIFLKGRKQKNMIWNHLEKKQGGKTYSTHPFFFGSLDGCQCFEDHFTWATWWSSSTREHFHHQPSRPVECLLVSSSARTLNGGAFACKGVPNHRDFYQTVNGETFQKNGPWETSMGFNIYIYIRYHMIVLIYGIDIYSLCVTCESKTSVSVSMNIMFVS